MKALHLLTMSASFSFLAQAWGQRGSRPAHGGQGHFLCLAHAPATDMHQEREACTIDRKEKLSTVTLFKSSGKKTIHKCTHIIGLCIWLSQMVIQWSSSMPSKTTPALNLSELLIRFERQIVHMFRQRQANGSDGHFKCKYVDKSRLKHHLLPSRW